MKKLFTLLFVLFALVSLAQQYSYRQYTIFDGLPQNQVTDLHIDPDGYLWIGTKGGICRFDGENFADFTNRESSNTNVRGIFTQSDSLYYYTSGILYCKRGEDFQEVFCAGDGQTIDSITPLDGAKGFVVNTFHEIYRWNYGDSAMLYSAPDNRLYLWKYISDNKYIFKKQNDVLGKRNDVFLYEKGEKKTLSKEHNGFRLANLSDDIVIYKMDTLLSDSVFYFDINRDTSVFVFTHDKDYVSRAFVLQNKKIAFVVNEYSWFITDSLCQIIDRDILPGNGISDIVEHNNNLFLATEQGLFLRNSAAFINYTEKDNIPGYVWSIVEDRDTNIVLAGFYGDLTILDENNDLRTVDFSFNDIPYLILPSFYMDGFVRKNGDWVIPMACGVFYGNEARQRFFTCSDQLCATPFCTWEDEKKRIAVCGYQLWCLYFPIARR